MDGKRKPLLDKDLFKGLITAHIKFYGLWDGMNVYRTTEKRSLRFILALWSAFVIITPYLFFQLISIIVLKVNFESIIFVFLNVVPSIQSEIKILVFWIYFAEQCKLFDLLTEDFLTSIPRYKQDAAKQIFRKVAWKTNVYCALAMGVNCSLTAMFTIFPAVDIGNGRKKVLGGWYPFPYGESPWYEGVYVYEVVLYLWHGILPGVFETILVMLLMGFYAQFLVLNHHIATLKKSDVVLQEGTTAVNDTEAGNAFLLKELEAIMKDYNLLLSYGETLKKSYNFLATVILGSGIAGCVITNLHILFFSDGFLFTFKFLLFFSYAAIEITLYCLASSFVETASSDVKSALYSSDWYEANKRYKGAIQMMMKRTTKPETLVALRMYPVNLEIVIGVFQFIYTTCTLLSEMK